VLEPLGIAENKPGAASQAPQPVILRIEGNKLVAEAIPQHPGYDPSELHVRLVERRGEKLALLDQPVAFFIPEHFPDPSRRPADEELWVEVTIPNKGPPRPIRLGVKKGDGAIAPLDLN
jgi:hypothetical protein